MSLAHMPEWWVFVVAAVLLGSLIYLDFSSRPARLRWARILALVLLVLTLLGIYVQPQVSVSIGTKRVVLQTPNALKRTLDSLQRLGFERVTDISKVESNVDELVVVGDGLETWELKKLSQPFTFVSASILADGPLDFHVGEAKERSPMNIQVQLGTSDQLELSVKGAGIDEVKQSVPKGMHTVNFTVTPQLAGLLTYRFTGVRGVDTLFTEPIPVQVKEIRPPAIVLLSGSPSFEWRYLKNHLGAAGFGVAERIQLSKDVFRESFTNMKEQSLGRLSEKWMEFFQTVVLDAAAYKALSTAERSTLTALLRQGNIGIVWIGELAQNSLVNGQKGDVRLLSFEGKSGAQELQTTGWQVRGGSPIFVQNQEVGHVVQVGLGFVVVPTVASSYTWMLRGEQASYADLWYELLQPAMGRRWQGVTTLPVYWENEPSLALLPSDERTKWLIDSTELPLRERWEWPNQWVATIWPKAAGWQSLVSSEGDSSLFFVLDSGAWPMKKTKQLQAQTAAYASISQAKISETKQALRPISPWYFFGLFLLAITFLWVEQRLG